MGKLIRFLLTPWRRYRQRRAWKKLIRVMGKAMMPAITAEPRKWFTLDRDE